MEYPCIVGAGFLKRLITNSANKLRTSADFTRREHKKDCSKYAMIHEWVVVNEPKDCDESKRMACDELRGGTDETNTVKCSLSVVAVTTQRRACNRFKWLAMPGIIGGYPHLSQLSVLLYYQTA